MAASLHRLLVIDSSNKDTCTVKFQSLGEGGNNPLSFITIKLNRGSAVSVDDLS